MGDFSKLRDSVGCYRFELPPTYLSQFKENTQVDMLIRIMTCVYYRHDTGYGVYDVELEDKHRFNIAGKFVEDLKLNGYYNIKGKVKLYKGERQVYVDTITKGVPVSEYGVINVLKTLRGLDTRAHLLYEHFGPDILNIIKERPEEVAKSVKGIGMKRVMQWREQLMQDKDKLDVYMMLTDYGIKPNKAKKLMKDYGDGLLEKLEKCPYFLLSETSDLSFKKCDEIALAHNYPLDGFDRISEAMMYVLQSELSKGNCYMEEAAFVQTLNQIIGIYLDKTECEDVVSRYGKGKVRHAMGCFSVDIDVSQVAKELPAMKPVDLYTVFSVTAKDLNAYLGASSKVAKIATDTGNIYMPKWVDRAESTIANAVREFNGSKYSRGIDPEPILDEYCKQHNIHLEKKQREAVLLMAKDRGGIYILNGAAGCGKTFTLKIILSVLKEVYARDNCKFQARIAAPTGKAAQVAGTATGMEGQTIHRMLGITGDTLSTDDVLIKNVDCLIVDEFSMVDVGLASSLFSCIGRGVKIILLGDTEQLPSVGPGSVLRDLIESNSVPTVTLDVVKRQGSTSGILKNANKIVNGEMIESEVSEDESNIDGNAYIIKVQSPEKCRDMMADFVKRQIQSGRFDKEEVQVLCPQKSTAIGTKMMNYCLQQALNPKRAGELTIPFAKIAAPDKQGKEELMEFRRGDKVIHIKNNYSISWYKKRNGQYEQNYDMPDGVVNGECGIIDSIFEGVVDGAKVKCMAVKYQKGYVIYKGEFDEVQLAYAMTVHKSQGSQWKLVVSPVMTCNYMMLNRKIFYTLYTRAQSVSVVLGQQKAIERAISNTDVASRKTYLQQRLSSK